jgi:hypothetical protein
MRGRGGASFLFFSPINGMHFHGSADFRLQVKIDIHSPVFLAAIIFCYECVL